MYLVNQHLVLLLIQVQTYYLLVNKQWTSSTTVQSDGHSIITVYPITFNTFLSGAASIQGGNWTCYQGTGLDANKSSGFMYPEAPSAFHSITVGI